MADEAIEALERERARQAAQKLDEMWRAGQVSNAKPAEVAEFLRGCAEDAFQCGYDVERAWYLRAAKLIEAMC